MWIGWNITALCYSFSLYHSLYISINCSMRLLFLVYIHMHLWRWFIVFYSSNSVQLNWLGSKYFTLLQAYCPSVWIYYCLLSMNHFMGLFDYWHLRCCCNCLIFNLFVHWCILMPQCLLVYPVCLISCLYTQHIVSSNRNFSLNISYALFAHWCHQVLLKQGVLIPNM